MSSVNASVTLSILCFPDITGATIKAWLLVTVNSGTYVTGGIPFGLLAFADTHTVDFNGFLDCAVKSELPLVVGTSGEYTYRYSPSTDGLQILKNGTEIAAGAIPAEVLADDIIAQATWNRTTVLG
jgi:hypothetical protein